MKFFLLLCLLISCSDVQGESGSLSFMNFIPNLIANVRFSQEDLIDSSLEFNQTLPGINLDWNFNVNQSNCSRDIQVLVRDLNARKIWALKTMDAWGKFPSGVMQGNIYWLGSVYECGHHLRGLNNSVIEQPLRTRTCAIGNAYSDVIRPVYGICVPQSCDANEIANYINQRVIRIPYIRRWIHLTNDSIRCIDQRSYDTKAILTIVLLTLIALFMLLATGLHITYGHKHDLRLDETTPTAYEPIVSRTITATESSVTTNTVTTTTVNTSLPAEDETAPLIVRSEPAVDSVAQRLISCCSLINNYQLLKHEHQPKSLACLNGIRVLSLWWVILGHTLLFAVFYSDNVTTVFNWLRNFWFQLILQGVFSIDSFFLLSGLLTAFLFFISKNENERFSTVKFLLYHYVYRYLRYTIPYAIILLIYITLSPYFGQGGPVYPIDGIETSTCRRTWWRNLLYINNLFDTDDSCMPITWFLAVNMQLHWIAPLFLLAASWKWFLGMLVVTVLIIVDIICTSVIVSRRNYDHGIFSDFYVNRTNTSDNYMNDVYVKPWCRVAPYAIGLALGYILYELYQRSNTLSWESILPQRRSARWNRLKQIVVWTVALFILSLCIFGTYGEYNDRPLTRSGRITFLALSRVGWSIGLGIIILTCFLGQGGIVNKWLSHAVFRVLGRLTYGAYLWHSLVLFVNYFGRDQPTHYTLANIFFNAIMHIIISYILSFVTFLLIELPIIQLLKLPFKRH